MASVDALTADAADHDIANVLADILMSAAFMPYRLGIDHDVSRERGTLKSGACLLQYDWRRKDTIGITAFNPGYARRWIMDALMFGYQVWRCKSEGPLRDDECIAGPVSIKGERSRARYRSEAALLPDDDIPF
jgi:hypothetical protein